ncbi:MAG: GNAT family N-acetyltransferase [Alphaproteobacteria bacterium PA2]|nr:MAG: GNAT family N-acetyltransferase [Alphaproteobacteria bacterium PA2]
MPCLVTPDSRYLRSFVAALREGFDRDTLRPETAETIAEVASDPEAFLESQLTPPRHITLPNGRVGRAVPSTSLWWVEGTEFLGWANIRHDLDERLSKVGGHIGYAVRPGARGQGHATAILAAALLWIGDNLPLKRVMLTVSPTNTASIRVIEANGGVFTAEVDHTWRPGETALQFWIDIPGKT